MSGFSNPIIGGDGTLVYPAIKSPDFVHGVSGWKIGKDGSAEFHDIILPGGQGVSVFFASAPPVTTHVGDLWYDTDNGLLLSRWSGSAWVPFQIGTGAIADNAVTTGLIADAAVGTAQIIAASITRALIADAAVGTGQIADSAITQALIAAGAVGTDQIAAASVVSDLIADGAVTQAQIADNAVGTANIIAGAITTALIADAAIGTSQIAPNSVTNALIASSAIETQNIADDAVTPAQISALTASLIGNAGGVLNRNPYFSGGDITGWNGGGTTFVITATDVIPAGAPFKYAAKLVYSTSTKLFDFDDAFPVESGQQYYVTAWVYTADTTISLGFDWRNASKAFLGTSQHLFTVTPNTWTQLTTVQTAIANAVIGNIVVTPSSTAGTIYAQALIALPQVPGSLIQAGTVTAAQIAAGTITAAEIAAGTITSSLIAANAITTGLIAAGAVTAAKIAAGTVVAGIVDATTINAATFTGSVFEGTDFIVNENGAFFYSGTPAANNLLIGIAGTNTVDPFGTPVLQGVSVRGSSGALIVIEDNGAEAIVSLAAGGTTQNTNAPQIIAGAFNVGQPNELTELSVTSGKENNLDDAAIILFSAHADGSSLAHASIEFGGTSVLNATKTEIDVSVPVVRDAWHTLPLAAGWTTGPTDPIRYRLLPDGNVQFSGVATHAGFTTTQTLSTALPAAYVPQFSQEVPAGQGTSNATGIAVATSGVVQCRVNMTGTTTTTCAPQGAYPLD